MDTESPTLDVVVVFNQQEYYLATTLEPPGFGISVELLQFQLFSLLALEPETQVILSANGDVLVSSQSTPTSLPITRNKHSVKFFVVSASKVPSDGLAPDWQQICTKSIFGNVPVVQPMFQNIGSSGFICQPCARTCTTAAAPVNPLDWMNSDIVSSKFISDIALVIGEVDVPAPPGFTKLLMDLNFSASGDYIYLCIKRGGSHLLTQVNVLFNSKEKAETHMSKQYEKVLRENCNSGNDSGVAVHLGYDSVFRKSVDAINTLAITDICVLTNDQQPPSPAYIKIPRNLNEGATGNPLYLWYTLAPIGGFICDAESSHSTFGECLFMARHLPNLHSLSDLKQEQLMARKTMAAERKRMDDAILSVHYQQQEPAMRSRLQSGLQRAQSYENKQMQAEALKRIPVQLLHERARANPSPMPSFQDELVKQLLHWFKREFFTWTNQPRCSACSHDKTQSLRTEGPSTPEEHAGGASRVEIYQCPKCRALTRFPRYNDPVKLLDTRTGRCGEWANCFTLCCRAMGFESRYVLDVTDHVWTEVYSEHFQRWLHCDSCEDQLDCPLTYEVGWGKKLSYIFSFSHEEVVDTARRYTQNWDEMRARRQNVSEAWLKTMIDQMNQRIWSQLPLERRNVLMTRAKTEQEELARGRSVKAGEVHGRVSGSAEWKSQRKEDGQNTAAKSSVTQKSSDGETITTPAPADSSSLSLMEISQQICKNLVLGCQSPDCPNPYCLFGRAKMTSAATVSSDLTERAAQAIQMVGLLSAKGFSMDGLVSFLCPTHPQGLRWFLLSKKPLLYLPLQDGPSPGKLLVDSSSHENHVVNATQCALHKPFKIPQQDTEDAMSYGLQILPGQQLSILMESALETFVLSFLVRLDLTVHDEQQLSDMTTLLAIDMDMDTSLELRFAKHQEEFICELRHGEIVATRTPPRSVVSFGLYAHVVLALVEDYVTVYVNRTELHRIQRTTKHTTQKLTLSSSHVANGNLFHSNGVAAVVSHVAILPSTTEEDLASFCREMKQRFVCSPPLIAYAANGQGSDKRSTQKVASSQSGYRVARIRMWGKEFLDGIQFIYERLNDADEPISPVFGTLIGNSKAKQAASSPTAEFELLPDELISRLSGRKGAWIDSISLHTNFGRQLTCGGKGGGDFSIKTPMGCEIRDIFFKVGDHLNDVIVFIAETPTIATDKSGPKEDLTQILAAVEPSFRQMAIAAAIRYLKNIITNPMEEKFQRIRASNKFFATNIAVMQNPTMSAFMQWCGFQMQQEAEEDEIFFVFQPHQTRSEPAILAAEAQKRIHFLS